MQLTLTDEEARTLRDYLRDHFHDLQLEVARTDQKEVRHVLVARQNLVERLLAQLDQPAQK